jgi:2-amino-4-hydroxy-6-hydroxymethyldihydropteridine diphosphokinase
MAIFLGLGSNLGNKSQNLKTAIKLLDECGVKTIKQSKVHITEAVSKVTQPDFANQVIEVATQHDPKKLLQIIKLIEHQMGRDRTHKKRPGYERPRIIDIDILIYKNLKINKRNLKIPHPRMNERQFVMKPLKEIAPMIN